MSYRTLASPLLAALLLSASATPASAAGYSPPAVTTRVQAPGGEQLNGDVFSERPGISADGRFVSFSSFATNLVPGDTNEWGDVFLYDRQTGEIERASVTSDGNQSAGHSNQSALSADGRFVAFVSSGEDLDPADDNDTYDVFVHDLQSGETRLVSVLPDGTQGNFGAEHPSISADGRYVAFTWHARNLSGDTNQAGDVYVRDMVTGDVELASVSSEEIQANGSSDMPSISADGRTVAFSSNATNLVPNDLNGYIENRHGRDAFVRDLAAGTTTRATVASDGTGANGRSKDPVLSGDGTVAAFISEASNLVPNDFNGYFDVFVHDFKTGLTERVSVFGDGSEATTALFGNFVGTSMSLSHSGRYLAFGTGSDLVGSDTNGNMDVYVHDRVTRSTERVSGPAVEGGVGGGNYTTISGDGRTVAFVSEMPDLVPGDTAAADLFMRDLGPQLGPGSAQVRTVGDELEVSGWVSLGGIIAASAADRADDAGLVGRRAGGELTGAELILRPEPDDLLIRWRIAEVPGARPPEAASGYPTFNGFLVCSGCTAPSASGAPAVTYVAELASGGIRYEVRATRLGGGTAGEAPSFTLHRCDGACELVTQLTGGYGTTGEELIVSVPLEMLATIGGEPEVRAFTVAGDLDSDAFVLLDEVALDEAPLGAPSVRLGIGPGGADPDSMRFEATASLSSGFFQATIDRSDQPDGDSVWIETCLAGVCDRRPVPLG